MILVAGLTPALQQIYLFDHFRSGDVNRAVEHLRCASGKVLNVGVALHLFGCESRVLSVVGNSNRDAIDAELTNLGMSCRWIETACADADLHNDPRSPDRHNDGAGRERRADFGR